MMQDYRCVYMYFVQRDGWYCRFLEGDLKTSLPRKLMFATADKVRDLAEQGRAFSKAGDDQLFDYAISTGRGGVFMFLDKEQYEELCSATTIATMPANYWSIAS